MSNARILFEGQILFRHLFIFLKITLFNSHYVTDFTKNLRFSFTCRDFTTFFRKNKNNIFLKIAENNPFISPI
jgi:hypothetical protein